MSLAVVMAKQIMYTYDLQRNWYVVYTKPHKEEQARFHLGLKGMECFFPRMLLPGSPGRKRKIVPLFPNYLFVRIHLSTELHHVVWSPGVKKIVSFGGQPIPLEESVVRFLHDKSDTDGIITACSTLERGQHVEISGGPFDGLLGIIQMPPDAKGRVKILLRLLNRQISVKLGVEFIRGEWVGFNSGLGSDIEPGLISAAG